MMEMTVSMIRINDVDYIHPRLGIALMLLGLVVGVFLGHWC